MAIRKIKNHGKWVWQARVAYRGLRRAAFRASKDEARQAESDLLGALKAEAAQVEQHEQRPATLVISLSSTPSTCGLGARVRRASTAWTTPGVRSRGPHRRSWTRR